jgi:hypothetical protein
MSEWQSNIPADLDLTKQYSPVRTAAEKKRQRELYNDPVFRANWNPKNQEAIDLKVQDPKWYADLVARNQAMANDPVRNQKIADTVSAQWADPEYKDWRTGIQQEVAQTDGWKESHAEGINKREGNGWEEKNAEAAKKRRKPIHAGEYGDFPGKKEAEDAMTEAGIVNAGGKLSVWLNPRNPKNRCTEYYYIKENR